MIVPLLVLSGLGFGGYKGWQKYGNQIKTWFGLGHPATATPKLASVPSSNPSGGTFVDPNAPIQIIPKKGEAVTLGSPAIVIGKTAGGNVISGVVDNALLAYGSSTAGQHLWDYISQRGDDGSPQLHALLLDYQTHLNSEKTLDGSEPLSTFTAVNGLYDLATGAQLSMLMGDSVPVLPANETIPPRTQWADQSDKSDPNDAAAQEASMMLYFRLRKTGHVKGDPTEVELTKAVQRAINKSPMFKKHGLVALDVDGDYGDKTRAAMKIYGLGV